MSDREFRTELKKAFDLLDKDEDGILDMEELSRLLSLLDVDIKNVKISEYLENGLEISREQFIQMMMDKLTAAESSFSYREIVNAFKLLDVDQTGTITNRNFAKLLRKLDEDSEPLTEEEISALIKQFDIHGKGELNYEDLTITMKFHIEKNSDKVVTKDEEKKDETNNEKLQDETNNEKMEG